MVQEAWLPDCVMALARAVSQQVLGTYAVVSKG